MAGSTSHAALSRHVLWLVGTAVESRGVPRGIAAVAAAATLKALSGREQTDRRPDWARIEAYFWAVVRRRIVRQRRPSGAAARLVLSAVVADLRESGRDSRSVWAELERGWTGKVPGDVLEEYRARLCA